MDFIRPFLESLRKNYLWVVMCCLTSQVHLVPVNMMTKTLELTHEFLNHVVQLHRLPTLIVSDRDMKFTSIFWTELHQLLGVKLKLSTAFHPQMDGQAKQMIQSVIQILRASICPDQRDW